MFKEPGPQRSCLTVLKNLFLRRKNQLLLSDTCTSLDDHSFKIQGQNYQTMQKELTDGDSVLKICRCFTYFNYDFKKGGWSPEEDMLLCEAILVLITNSLAIAISISDRKRVLVPCRLRRVLFEEFVQHRECPLNTGKSHFSDVLEKHTIIENSVDNFRNKNQLVRHPFAVLVQNFHNAGGNTLSHQHVNNIKETSINASDNKSQGTFLKRNDPKHYVLMQQAELLSSLALKVNSENNDQTLES
nr:transcription factor MYB88-like [Nicotiana tomentosiformis]